MFNYRIFRVHIREHEKNNIAIYLYPTITTC